MVNIGVRALTVMLAVFSVVAGAAAGSDTRHVIVIGVDGLSPLGIEKAETPVLDRLCAEGAHTFHARAVLPTVSSPNWASILMGAGPEQHGVTSNKWMPFKYEIAPVTVGPGGMFPTIFAVLRGQRKDSVLAVVHDWDGFGRLVERKLVDVLINGDGEDDTVKQALAVWRDRQPTLLFVHLDHVDHALHQHGFMTPEYVRAIERCDRMLGQFVAAADAADAPGATLLMVVSDQGGKDKGHGGNTMEEIEVPWIIRGPGVTKGKEIVSPVNSYDTAATVAKVLGVTPPEAWIGHPVDAAFAP